MSNIRIIIKKKATSHDDHHGGAWKVAYADLVTAMMAFFLVMWLISQGPEVRENVAAYFADPIGFSDKVASGSGMLAGSPDLAVEVQPEEGEVEELLKKKALEIQLMLKELERLQELDGEIVAEVEPAGLRIQLREADESSFFGLGSAALSEKGSRVLQAIGKIIAPMEYDVILEGHTDAKTYPGGSTYTNWELSTDRANAARRVLESSGVAATRLTAVGGYASTQLRFPENPLDPRNRRIEILVRHPQATAAP
ncbi:MAG: flagellar motor protein MotB [Candidatus Eiseniibacteriota bacterium]